MNSKFYKREWFAALVEARRLLVVTLRLVSNEEFKRIGTAGACPTAAFLLHATLVKHAPQCAPVITSGYRQDAHASHYWVQITDENSQVWDLDTSADQFGDRRLVCAPHDPQFTPYQFPVAVQPNPECWMGRNMITFEKGSPDPQTRIDRIMNLFTSGTQ